MTSAEPGQGLARVIDHARQRTTAVSRGDLDQTIVTVSVHIVDREDERPCRRQRDRFPPRAPRTRNGAPPVQPDVAPARWLAGGALFGGPAGASVGATGGLQLAIVTTLGRSSARPSLPRPETTL